MCGLAGFARANCSAISSAQLRALFDNLLAQMETRGRHAVGLAADGGAQPFVWKWAVPARDAIKSPGYADAVTAALGDHRIVIGHTRHATQNNAKLDAAAHPFRMGDVVGAHNGMIHNWTELAKTEKPATPWIVDSQAIFALLDKHKNANTALNKLDGYWALTWIKRKRLYVCRTPDAQLTMAYHGETRTLVWASTQWALRDALKRAGFAPHAWTFWEPKSATLYEFDPDEFTAEGANPAKQTLDFASRGKRTFDTSATDERALTGPVTTSSSTQLTLTQIARAQDDADAWEQGDGYRRYRGKSSPADAIDPGAGKPTTRRGKRTIEDELPPLAPAEQFARLWTAVTALRDRMKTEIGARAALSDVAAELSREVDVLTRRVDALEAENETLRAESAHLYGVLNAHNLVDTAPVDPPSVRRAERARARALLPV